MGERGVGPVEPKRKKGGGGRRNQVALTSWRKRKSSQKGFRTRHIRYVLIRTKVPLSYVLASRLSEKRTCSSGPDPPPNPSPGPDLNPILT